MTKIHEDFDSELTLGREEELEHTDTIKWLLANHDATVAQAAERIARDHLSKVSDYYTKLKKYVEPTQESHMSAKYMIEQVLLGLSPLHVLREGLKWNKKGYGDAETYESDRFYIWKRRDNGRWAMKTFNKDGSPGSVIGGTPKDTPKSLMQSAESMR